MFQGNSKQMSEEWELRCIGPKLGADVREQLLEVKLVEDNFTVGARTLR